MASLFRPWITHYLDAKGNRVAKETPGACKRRVRSRKWYARYRDAHGTRRCEPLSSDKSAAQMMLAERLGKVERERSGQTDPFEEPRKRPLADHVAEYRRHLEAKGNAPAYVRQAVQRLERLTDACGFGRLPDIQAARVVDWLQSLKEAGRAAATFNSYLIVAKGFCRWAVRERRMPYDPLAHLSKLNERTDVRLERRSLAPEEFTLLIETTRRSADVFRRLRGTDRAMLYTVAAYSGLRAGELSSLTVESLSLEGSPPTITLEAGYSKRRRKDVQPLPAWLGDRMTEWLAERAAEPRRLPATLAMRPAAGRQSRLWPGAWSDKAARMLQADLEAARAAWIDAAPSAQERTRREASDTLAYVDEAGRVFDFHALRHQYISNLAAAGVHPKVAQTLARHSTVSLTLDRYTHLAAADVVGALESLPAVGRPAGSEATQARATGTDATGPPAGSEAHRGRPKAPRTPPDSPESATPPDEAPTVCLRTVCAPGAISGHLVASEPPPKGVMNGASEDAGQETRKPLSGKGFRNESSERRARESNPQPVSRHHISSVAASHSLTLRIRL